MRNLLVLILFVGCTHQEFEMEELSKTVLKEKRGVEITVEPKD